MGSTLAAIPSGAFSYDADDRRVARARFFQVPYARFVSVGLLLSSSGSSTTRTSTFREREDASKEAKSSWSLYKNRLLFTDRGVGCR